MAGGNGDLRDGGTSVGVLQRSQSLLVSWRNGVTFQCVARGRELTHLNQIKSSVCSFLHSVTLLPASPANCRLVSSFVALTGSNSELLPPPLSKEIEPLSQLLLRNQTSSGRFVEKHSWQQQEEVSKLWSNALRSPLPTLDRPPATRLGLHTGTLQPRILEEIS